MNKEPLVLTCCAILEWTDLRVEFKVEMIRVHTGGTR